MSRTESQPKDAAIAWQRAELESETEAVVITYRHDGQPVNSAKGR